MKLQTLQNLREKYGLSHEDIFLATKLQVEWLRDFELGKKEPWPIAISRLSKFFGLSPNKIFPEIFKPSPLYRPCTELKYYREKKNLSQVQLGLKAKLGGTYICRFETGAAKPWPAAMKRLSRALRQPTNKIFPHLCNTDISNQATKSKKNQVIQKKLECDAIQLSLFD